MPAWVEFIGEALGLVLTGLIILSPFLIWLSKLMIEKIVSHEFENEREALKYQIATLLGRSTKLHDREFETLEAVWEKASISMGSAAGVLSLFQSSPDVTWIEGDALDYRLSRCELPDYQVAELKALKGMPRTRKLHDFLMEKKRVQANLDWYDFQRLVILKGVFLKPDIEAKARALANLISELLDESAWTAEEGGKNGTKSRRELSDRIQKEGATLRDEIRAMIAARLWDVELKKAA